MAIILSIKTKIDTQAIVNGITKPYRPFIWGRKSYLIDETRIAKIKIGKKTAEELMGYEEGAWEDDQRTTDWAHPYNVFSKAMSGSLRVSMTWDHLSLIIHCIDNSLDIYQTYIDDGEGSHAVARSMRNAITSLAKLKEAIQQPHSVQLIEGDQR